MKWLTVAAVALLGCACAKSPESISPSYISDVGYQSWSCQQLGEEQQRLGQALAVASQQQEKARTNDTVGVILLGLPVSSLSGDNIAPEIARLKGEQELPPPGPRGTSARGGGIPVLPRWPPRGGG